MDIVSNFIEHHQKKVLDMFREQKGITPFFTFLCKTEDNKGEVMILEVPESLMFNEGKDFVRNVLIEKIKKDLKKKNKNLVCVNFNSESWMYHGNKGDLNVLNGEYRKLPKSEVLLMVFDSEQESRQITYEIKRNLFVGEDGLDEEVGVELYKLGEDVKMSGRFSNLF
jgi:hypothetical protein